VCKKWFSGSEWKSCKSWRRSWNVNTMVYRFDGTEMHVSLSEKLIDILSNTAIHKEMNQEKV